MAQRTDVGSRSARAGGAGGAPKRKLGWLWLLIPLVLLAGLIALLVANNAGDDDTEGVTLSGDDCPGYAGEEGKDETEELAADAGPFLGCKVAVAGPVGRVIDEKGFELQGDQTGGRPILVVVGSDEESAIRQGELVRVSGELKEKLDPQDLPDGVDSGAYAPLAGRPYILAEEAGAPEETTD
jgi:hypothetical protein